MKIALHRSNFIPWVWFAPRAQGTRPRESDMLITDDFGNLVPMGTGGFRVFTADNTR